MGEIISRPIPPTQLHFTGERLTSDLTGQTQIEHIHRYLLAREYCRTKDVLDVASGEGYGSAFIAQVARSVVGIEIASDAVAHARSSYRLPNLRYVQGDARIIPLEDSSVDVVVSFETIEHFAEHDQFLSEIRRVLRSGGMLIVSTPDRDNYSPTESPANPYHVLELTTPEFDRLLKRHFTHVQLLFQRPIYGSVMLPDRDYTGSGSPFCFEKRGERHFEASVGLSRPQYIVAIASDSARELSDPSVYIESSRLAFHAPHEYAAMLDTATRQLRDERDRYESEISVLHAQRDAERKATASRAATLEATIVQHEVELQQHLLSTQAVTQELVQRTAAVEQLKDERDAAQRALAAETEISSRDRATIQNLEAGNAASRELIRRLQRANADQAAALQELRRKLETERKEAEARAAALQELRRELETERKEAEARAAALQELRRELETERKEAEARAAALQELRRELETERKEAEARAAFVARADAEFRELVAQRTMQTNGRIAQLEAEIQVLGQQQNAAAHDAAVLLASAVNETDLLRQQHAQLQALFQATQQSTSWKLTSPLRWFAARFPGVARLARRLGKLVWWTLTLQLFAKLQEFLYWRRYHAAAAPPIEAAAPTRPTEAVAAPPTEAAAAAPIEAAAPTRPTEAVAAPPTEAAAAPPTEAAAPPIEAAAAPPTEAAAAPPTEAAAAPPTEAAAAPPTEAAAAAAPPIAAAAPTRPTEAAMPLQHALGTSPPRAAPPASTVIWTRPSALFIDYQFPRPNEDAGSEYTITLIRAFQAVGYEVAFITDPEPEPPPQSRAFLDRICVRCVCLPDHAAIEAFLVSEGPYIDVCLLSRVNSGGLWLALARRYAPQARMIFSLVDLHHLREQRDAKLRQDRRALVEAMRTRERELAIVRLADATITPSSFELATLEAAVPGANVVLLPLTSVVQGSEREFCARADIGFLGGYRHLPNVDAVNHFLDNIWPIVHRALPDVRFRALGADLPDEIARRGDPGFVPVGFVEHLKPELERLRVMVAPLRYGAGAKGKVVTSLAYGLPCVVSPVAAEGMELADGDAVAVAYSDTEFARKIIELYTEEARWTAMSDSAVATARRAHSFEAALAVFRKMLATIGAPMPKPGVASTGEAFR